MAVMTPHEVSDVTGVTPEQLRHWQQLGLLSAGDELDSEDVERVRLVQFADERGISPEELARISATQGDLLARFVRWALRPGRQEGLTLEEAATNVGVERDLLDRFWFAAGFGDQTVLYEEDVEALRLMKAALDLGLPIEALQQILRVLADASNKSAETIVRIFHLYVHERMRAEGASGDELMEATQSISDPMVDLVEPAIMYFHRKSWERANREDMMLHLIEETTPPTATKGELWRAVLFVDLSSFTPLTEAMGDDAAAGVLQRFSAMVRSASVSCNGQVVKQIGDEFMLVFPTKADALSFGLGIRRAAAAEPRFPAVSVGAHAGNVLYREGDYLGANVNLAARVTSAAERNQLLVTDALIDNSGPRTHEFVSLGETRLKGIGEPVELFEVRDGIERISRHTDPICGMELDEASAEAQLTWEGERLLFCSGRCLRLFLDRSTVTDAHTDSIGPMDSP